jgi:uncharacterized protein
MDPWFEDRLDKENIRRYTRKRLKNNSFSETWRKFGITTWILIINVIFFLISTIFISIFGAEQVFYWIALQPNAFFSGAVWTLITSMFMHGSLTHLFVNMVSLFFIGNFVEKLIGRKRYLWFYLISGIIAGLTFVFLAYFFGTGIGENIFGSAQVFAVGASGAIFALGGLLAILTPKMRVYVFFFIPMQMWIAMVVLLVVLWVASISAGLPFGNTAHFGGLLAGVIYGVYLKKKYKRKTQIIAQYFS